MKVFINSTNYNGSVSQITWDNERLLAALNEVFSVQPNEQLVELHVTAERLTAVFQTVTKTEGSDE